MKIHGIIHDLEVDSSTQFYLLRSDSWTLQLDIHPLKQEATGCEEVCPKQSLTKIVSQYQGKKKLTVWLATVYEASMVSFPENILNALALNSITFTAFSFWV